MINDDYMFMNVQENLDILSLSLSLCRYIICMHVPGTQMRPICSQILGPWRVRVLNLSPLYPKMGSLAPPKQLAKSMQDVTSKADIQSELGKHHN